MIRQTITNTADRVRTTAHMAKEGRIPDSPTIEATFFKIITNPM